jgi:prepilin-type N-terminal cleavage/methylation domain-containing protein
MRTTVDNKGFTAIELLIAVTILGFLVAAAVNVVNYKKDAVEQTASKLMSDMSAIEMAFTNYNTDKNAYPTDLTDSTFVGGKYLFVPVPPDGFTAYSMSSNADGYYLCASASVSGTTDYKYESIARVQSRAPNSKSYRNTSCPATANADPVSYPATLHLTYWIFRN